MTKKAKKELGFAFDASAFDNPFTAAFLKSSEAFTKSMQVWPAEMTDFISRRMRADAKLYADFAQCKDWTEMSDIQRDWLKQTNEDYMEEANKMMALGQEALNEATMAAQEGVKALDSGGKIDASAS